MLKATQPRAVVITVLSTEDFNSPDWQHTPEIALPQALVPWIKQQGLPLYGVVEPSPDTKALEDFKRYAKEYPKLLEQLQDVEARLQPVAQILEQSLDLERIQHELLPLLFEYQSYREQICGDGPGTDWLGQRVQTMAQRILEMPFERMTILASAEHCPLLSETLKPYLLELPKVEATDESRERSLLDFAFRVDVPEVGNLMAQLRNLKCPEARYHEANLLLAHGHVLEALEVLECVSQENFSEPYYLPGYVLARLGQLYDLTGKRDSALRCYRGVKALSFAPAEALEQALKGLEEPFALSGK